MEAVIAQHKPRQRAAPSPSPWSAWATATESPSDHRWHLTTPEQLTTASSRIVLVSPGDAWRVLGGTLESLARRGHPILLVEVDTRSETTLQRVAGVRRTMNFPHQRLQFQLDADTAPQREKGLAEWLPVGSGDTVFVPWRHDGPAENEACARATLAACRTVNARCIEFPVAALQPSQSGHPRLRRSVLRCVRLGQTGVVPAACEWTLA